MSDNRSLRWTWVCFIAGGVLMILLWIIYTTVHGPTSFDRTGVVLGRSTLFWGGLLGSFPNLLLALGLILLYPTLVKSAGFLALIGYILTLIGLIIPAVIDIFAGGLGPPIFVPLVGIGLILTVVGNRGNPTIPRGSHSLLMVLGLLQITAIASAFVPQEVSDDFGGYRLYGILAHFAFGLGWILLGVWMLRRGEASGVKQMVTTE